MIKRLITLIFVFLVLGISPALAFDTVNQGTDAIHEVMEYIYRHHISRPELDTLAEGAIKGMLDTLNDPYTEYLGPDDLKKFTGELDGEFVGVGVELEAHLPYPRVVKVLEGSPALKAGLRPGDYIIKVDGKDIGGQSLPKVVEKIRGPSGTQVNLTIRRAGVADFDVQIVRAAVTSPTVESSILPGNVGYISIHTFGSRTAGDFAAALKKLGNVRGLILDLRNDPGGYLQAAVDIAGNFLPPGEVVVKTVDRDNEEEVYRSASSERVWNRPVVVLINGFSASAAEVLAGALQDYGVAVLVGANSCGKGVVQAVVPLESGGALKMTVARYLTPKGRFIDQNGLIPDRMVLTPELQLFVARQILLGTESERVVFTTGSSMIKVDEEKIDGHLLPLVRGKEVYLPLRLSLEALGYQVQWEGREKRILVDGRGKRLVFSFNGETALVNNQPVSVLLSENRYYLPSHFWNLIGVKSDRRGSIVILEVK